MNRRNWKLSAVATMVLSVAALASWRMAGQAPGDAIPTAIAAVRSFKVSVQTVGQLDAQNATVIYSPLKGSEAKIIWLVEEGTWVEQGDELVKLDPSEYEKKLDLLKEAERELTAKIEAENHLLEWEKHQAQEEIKAKEYELKTAEIDLRKIQNGEGPLELSQLETVYSEATSEHARFVGYLSELKQYAAQNLVSAHDIEEAEKKTKALAKKYQSARKKYGNYRDFVLPANIEKAKATVSSARIALEQTRKGGGLRIGKALAAWKLARKERNRIQAKLASARTDLKNTVVRAPIRGIAVLKKGFFQGENRKARVGDHVIGMQPLVYLPDISTMVVETAVREIDLHKITPGKPARVLIDAYPQLELAGSVTSIGVMAQRMKRQEAGNKYFSIKVRLDGEDMRLRPGMTARVEILSANLHALSVPLQAIFRENQKDYCYVRKESRFTKRAVRLGGANNRLVAILDGIEKDTAVAVTRPPQSLIHVSP